MKTVIVLLTLLLSADGLGQQKADFVLNPLKPYVYLEFDHLGPRKPIRSGESDMGLWLRIVKNSRLPILVPTFGLAAAGSGAGVLDEVVSSEMTTTVTTEVDPIGTENKSTESNLHPSTQNTRKIPQGYSSEISSMTRILPGRDLLFSVPSDHVSDHWFLRIRFILDTNTPQTGIVPSSYLDFFKSEIPVGARHAP
jgi:hypothetical protein